MREYSALTQTLLKERGLQEKEEIDIFLNPDYERDLRDPFLMRDMKRSCERIYEAVLNNERIVIYADYDCDGIPGAVILQDFFKKINYQNFEVYIPQRNSEGYGLSIEPLESFSNRGVKLLITIDLGITAHEEVGEAKRLGIDVIITDHHLPRIKDDQDALEESLNLDLPNAYAILNPKVDDYPEKMLCGAGVVFKLVQGLIQYTQKKESSSPLLRTIGKMPIGWEKWLLDMAGLATLSDLVPLKGENRALSYFGMKVLRKSRRPGLQKLLNKMNIDQRYLTEDDIGFMVTPRLNAASRMDDPMRAFELLATEDEEEAGTLANHLSKINDERKTTVATIMRGIKKNFEKRELREVVVVGHPEWKVGVLGLIAGKITSEYNRAAFVWGKDENDLIKGSCRSPGTVSVVDLMTEVKESFIDFGGHHLAGGFTVHEDRVHFLEEELSGAFAKVGKDKNTEDEDVKFDLKGDLSLVNLKTWKELEAFAPFGVENPKPIFLFEKVKVAKLKKFGKNGSGEHLEITFTDVNNNKSTAIAFFSNEDSFKTHLFEGAYVNVYANLDLSRFRGRAELRLRIVDII